MLKRRKPFFMAAKFLLVLLVLCVVWIGGEEDTEAACTDTCGKCSGLGYYYSNSKASESDSYVGTYINSSGSTVYTSGWSYKSRQDKIGCGDCGGTGSQRTYYSLANYQGSSILVNSSYKAGSGRVSKSCSYAWSYFDSNGISGGGRQWKCTNCNAVSYTQYALYIYAGSGIASASGTGWYNAGTTGIYVSCEPKTGYRFTQWSDGDTNQNWTMQSTMDRAKSFTAYAEPIVYTQTINHYLWNPDTSAWNYWTTTTASAAYDSVFYPSYTATPSGYYNYSLDWSGGWTVSGAGTFCAYYYPNTYSVSYNANGGSGAPASHNFVYNSTAYLSWTQPTRTGYTFSHWTVNENGAAMSPGQQIPKGWGSFSLTAQWTPNQYNLTVNPNGGTFADGTTAAKTADPKLTYAATSWWHVGSFVPTRTGYTFEGFYDSLSGGTKVYDATGACVLGTSYWNSGKQYCYAGNLVVYARWSENEYTVTYDANGGETATQTKTFHYNEEVDLSPVATKAGKIFVGWSTEPDAKAALHTLVMPDLATSANPDHADWEITLYAVYSVAVSDVANHTYPDYDATRKKEQEVFVRVYDGNHLDNYRDYALSYTEDTNTMVYRYTMDVDMSEFVEDMEKYFYAIYVYDNAGNWSVIHTDWVYQAAPPDEPEPEPETEDPSIKTYCQTVEHYRYDVIKKKWEKCFSDTRTEVKEGEMFTPSHITPPTGYHKAEIEYPDGYVEAGKITDGSYGVTEPALNRVYYKPNTYTLTFDANGGTIAAGSTLVNKIAGRISYDVRYGMVGFDYDADEVYTDAFGFPTPEKEGHTFMGWYTQPEAGEVVESSDKYEMDKDSTLYAHWQINSYTVTYDYWTNGGTDAAIYQKAYDYQSSIDLSVAAQKSGSGLNGWTYIGWNTDADATTALSEYIIGDKDVVLYAIFQKDISLTVIEDTDTGIYTSTQTKSIFNRETKADFVLDKDKLQTWTGWELLGFTTETGAEELPVVGPDGVYTASENITLYGLYEKAVTLSYDTNGSALVYEPQTKTCYHNASGESQYPSFIIAAAPVLSKHSFVEWKVENGTILDENDSQIDRCSPGDEVALQTAATLTACWDVHPVIEAYNRYFTLEQAKSGAITEAELLAKVCATDEEAKHASNPDGILQNGVDVIVKNYNASDFINANADEEFRITYQATDSFGNVVEKTVVIQVVDTTMKKSPKVRYVRFISSKFFADEEGNLLPPEKGGLEETSIWRTNIHYQNLLRETLTKKNATVNEKETWVFTSQDIKALKEQLYTNGWEQ